MAERNLGRIGFVLRGPYSSSASYQKLDVVLYNGDSYACSAATSGTLPSNTDYWTRLTSHTDYWAEIYPVGSLYFSSAPTSPASLFGGSWVRVKDKFLLASGDTYAAGDTGGSATVELENEHLPVLEGQINAHNGAFTSFSGIVSAGTSVGVSTGIGALNNAVAQEAARISFGGGQPHENMPPYVAVYVWERIE